MKENFLEKILENPRSLSAFPGKDIYPLTHDFDSESLSDRLYSLYSVLVGCILDNKTKSILIKYKSELAFIKAVNKINSQTISRGGYPSDIKAYNTEELVKVEYSKLISNNRDNILEKLFN